MTSVVVFALWLMIGFGYLEALEEIGELEEYKVKKSFPPPTTTTTTSSPAKSFENGWILLPKTMAPFRWPYVYIATLRFFFLAAIALVPSGLGSIRFQLLLVQYPGPAFNNSLIPVHSFSIILLLNSYLPILNVHLFPTWNPDTWDPSQGNKH